MPWPLLSQNKGVKLMDQVFNDYPIDEIAEAMDVQAKLGNRIFLEA